MTKVGEKDSAESERGSGVMTERRVGGRNKVKDDEDR